MTPELGLGEAIMVVELVGLEPLPAKERGETFKILECAHTSDYKATTW